MRQNLFRLLTLLLLLSNALFKWIHLISLQQLHEIQILKHILQKNLIEGIKRGLQLQLGKI
jgi:hypothetical protein